MNYSIDTNTIDKQIKVHTGSGKVKIVIRVTGRGRQSFFDDKREVRIYTRTLILGDDLRIKKIYEDENSNCWFTDVQTAKRIADRYGKYEGQRIQGRRNDEIDRALRELERALKRAASPKPRPTRTRRSSGGAGAGLALGALAGLIIGAAIDARK
jgi:hypothetical protein